MAIYIYPANFPPGVTWCNVLVEVTDFTGRPVSGNVRVEGERKIAWSGSPRILSRFSRAYRLNDGGVGIPLPHTDQTGFVAEDGLPVTGWGYKLTLELTNDSKVETLGFVKLPQSLGLTAYLNTLVSLGGWPNATIVVNTPANVILVPDVTPVADTGLGYLTTDGTI